MRASVASITKKFISLFFAATLALGLVPAAAFAAENDAAPAANESLSLIPEGAGDAVSIASSTEGGSDDVFSHYPSDDSSSVDGGSVDTPSEDVIDTDDARGIGVSDFDVINQEVALDTVVAQAESAKKYFLAQTLESTRTVPIVSAKLPIDTGAPSESSKPIESDASENEEGEDSDGFDLGNPNRVISTEASNSERIGEVSSASTVIGSFEYLGMTFAVEPGGESVVLVATDYNKLPEVFVEKQVVAIPEAATADDIDYYSVTRIADNAFSSFKKENANLDYIGCEALFSDAELLAKADIDSADIQQFLADEVFNDAAISVESDEADDSHVIPSDSEKSTPIEQNGREATTDSSDDAPAIVSSAVELTTDEPETTNDTLIRAIVSMDGNVATLDDDSTYTFTNPLIGCTGVLVTYIPASVTIIEDDAFAGFETLQYIVVSEDNPNYSSYGGALYDADLTQLRFIPEGHARALMVSANMVEFFPAVRKENNVTLFVSSLNGSSVALEGLGVAPDRLFSTLLLVLSRAVNDGGLTEESGEPSSVSDLNLNDARSYSSAWTPSGTFTAYAYGTDSSYQFYSIGSMTNPKTYYDACYGDLPTTIGSLAWTATESTTNGIVGLHFDNERLILHLQYLSGGQNYDYYSGRGLTSTGGITRVQYSTSVNGALYDVPVGPDGIRTEDIAAQIGSSSTPAKLYLKISTENWNPSGTFALYAYGADTTYKFHSVGSMSNPKTYHAACYDSLSTTLGNAAWTSTETSTTGAAGLWFENGRLVLHFQFLISGKYYNYFSGRGLTSAGGITRVQYSTSPDGTLYDVPSGPKGIRAADIAAQTGKKPTKVYLKFTTEKYNPSGIMSLYAYGKDTTYRFYSLGRMSNPKTFHEARNGELSVVLGTSEWTATETTTTGVTGLWFDNGRLIVHCNFILPDSENYYDYFTGRGLASTGGITRVQYSTSVDGALYDLPSGVRGITAADIAARTGKWPSQIYLKFTTEASDDNAFSTNWIGNGGKWSDGCDRKATWVLSTSAAQTDPGTLPTRSGYKFYGWSTSSTATPVTTGTNAPKTSVQPTTTATYYAVWGLITTVTLQQNGATTEANPKTLYYVYGTKQLYTDAACTTAYTASSIVPKKTSYFFDGYYSTDGVNATTQYLTSAGAMTSNVTTSLWDNTTATKTIYAKWIPVSEVKVYRHIANDNADTTSFYYKHGGTTLYTSAACTSAWTASGYALTRTGYDFNGFYSAKTGGTQYLNSTPAVVSGLSNAYKVTTSPVSGTSAIQLHAQWTPYTYTIVFNNNGGSGSKSISATYGVEYELPDTGFTKTGHDLDGWNLGSASGTSYAKKAKVSDLTTTKNGTVTFYARYVPRIYTVTLKNATGGTHKTVYMKYGSGWYADSACSTALKDTDVTAPSRTGFECAGYSTSSTATSPTTDAWTSGSGDDTAWNASKRPSNTLWNGTTLTQTMYPIWKATVSWKNPNGSENKDEKEYKFANSSTTSFTVNHRSQGIRTGYSPTGWTIGNDATKYTTGTITLTGTSTMNATWSENTYYIAVAKGDGIASVASEQITVKGSATSVNVPSATVAMGHSFGTWTLAYDKDGGATSGLTLSSPTSATSAKITVSVKDSWKKDSVIATVTASASANSYEITWDANGGTVDGQTSVKGSQTYGQNITLPDATKVKREGYTFIGWYTGNDFKTEITSSSKVQAATPTYIAKWSTPVTGTVILDPKGGSFTREQVEAYRNASGSPKAELNDDGTVTITYDVTTKGFGLSDLTPTLTGSSFGGWTGVVTPAWNDQDLNWGAAKTYTASWSTNVYEISYVYKAGNDYKAFEKTTWARDDDRSVSAETALPTTYNEANASSKMLPALYKRGYAWGYWTVKDGDGTHISAIPPASTGAITIEAHFTANPYTITVDLDGGRSEGGIYKNSFDMNYDAPSWTLPSNEDHNLKKDGYKFSHFAAYKSEADFENDPDSYVYAKLEPGDTKTLLGLGSSEADDARYIRAVWVERIAVTVPTEVNLSVYADYVTQKLYFQHNKADYEAGDSYAPLTFISYTTAPVKIVSVTDDKSCATAATDVFGEKVNQVGFKIAKTTDEITTRDFALGGTTDTLNDLVLEAAENGSPKQTTFHLGMYFNGLTPFDIEAKDKTTIARLHYTVALANDAGSIRKVLETLTDSDKKIVW